MPETFDSNLQTLHRYTRQFTGGMLPDFVSDADTTSIKEAEQSLQSNQFADPVSRRYPIHTKAATWVSCLYFFGDRANGVTWDGARAPEAVQDRLEKAAAVYKLLPDLRDLQGRIKEASTIPSSLPENAFALAETFAGKRVLRLPINNEAAIRKSASMFITNRDSYPLAWRKKAARALLVAMSDKDVRVDEPVLDCVVKAACLYRRPTEEVISSLIRRYYVADEKTREMTAKVASAILSGRTDFEELAEALDQADTATHADTYYGDAFQRPEEMLFAGVPRTAKQASADVVTLTSGSAYRAGDLLKAGARAFQAVDDVYAAALGENPTAEKMAEIAVTIPRTDAKVLERTLAACGIKPLEKEASRKGLPSTGSQEEWASFFQEQGLKYAPLSFSVAVKPAFSQSTS